VSIYQHLHVASCLSILSHEFLCFMQESLSAKRPESPPTTARLLSHQQAESPPTLTEDPPRAARSPPTPIGALVEAPPTAAVALRHQLDEAPPTAAESPPIAARAVSHQPTTGAPSATAADKTLSSVSSATDDAIEKTALSAERKKTKKHKVSCAISTTSCASK